MKDTCYPDDGLERGIPLFDELSRHQRLALVAQVAAALFKAEVEAPSPSAIIEATVGVIFEIIRVELVCEVEHDSCCIWRPLVLACVNLEDYDADFHVDLTTTDLDDLELLVETIQCGILWDTDWTMNDLFLDAPPNRSRKIKRDMGIAPNYCTVPAPDPTDEDMPDIISRLDELTA